MAERFLGYGGDVYIHETNAAHTGTDIICFIGLVPPEIIIRPIQRGGDAAVWIRKPKSAENIKGR